MTPVGLAMYAYLDVHGLAMPWPSDTPAWVIMQQWETVANGKKVASRLLADYQPMINTRCDSVDVDALAPSDGYGRLCMQPLEGCDAADRLWSSSETELVTS